MLYLRTLGFLSLGAVLLTGCQPVASPLMGVFFNDTKFGYEATSNAAATKEGKACAQTILGLVATGDASISAAKAAGVTCSLTTEIELADPRSSAFGWGRLEVGEHDTGAVVAAKLNGHYAWMGAAREGFRAVFRS